MGVCKEEERGRLGLVGGGVCRDSTGAAAPTDDTSLPPRSPLLPLQTSGPTAGGHRPPSPHTGRNDDGPSAQGTTPLPSPAPWSPRARRPRPLTAPVKSWARQRAAKG